MKYILVIGDGMADHPLDTLAGRTPLEASKKDAIDDLARRGVLGTVRNVPDGFAPGSRYGHHVHLRLLAAQILFRPRPA